jgi:hypothetical protein
LHALDPGARQQLPDLGTGQGQHHEGLLGQLAQRLVHEPDGERVSPVEILEHEEHRVVGALGLEEGHQRPAGLDAHQPRISPRRAQLRVVLVREGNAAQLSEEGGHLRGLGGGQVLGEPLGQPLPAEVERLSAGQTAHPAQGLGDQSIRGAGAHGIAAAQQHHHLGVMPLQAAKELVAQPGLAHAWRGCDQRRLGGRLPHAGGEGHLQQGQLLLAADAGGGPAQQRTGLVRAQPLAMELEQAGLGAGELEARPEQPRRHLVQQHWGRGGGWQ